MKQIAVLLFSLSFTLFTYGQQTDHKVKILDNYAHINSIAQMLSAFKGKPVFVDIWATWCNPCLDEFKYKNDLGRFLKKKHIALLYMSINSNEEDVAWKSTIDSLELTGYHIRVNQTLLNELTTQIWGAPGGYSIPRFLLFNKTGKLVLKDALPPDSGIKLYEQLQAYLKE
jgi:thiol-disulfide isomerase/thioredoxin